MSELNRHLKALEYDKILEMAMKRACNDDARDIIASIRPETSVNMAQNHIDMTENAYILLAKYGGPSFGGLKNVNNSLARASAGGVLSMKELLDIGSTIRTVRGIREWRNNSGGQDELKIDLYFNSLMPNKYLEDKIFGAILTEEDMSDNASPELANIRRQIKNKENSVRDQLEKLIRSQKLKTVLQDAIITQRNGRYVVPVKSEHRASVSGLVHDTSSTGATVFVEPAGVVEANNDIRVLRGKEAQEIERILYELSVEAGGFIEEIKGSYECAVEINVIFCKAHLAYDMKATMPILNDKGITDLKKARHPLIDPKKVVATDIRLGSDFDTLVITGYDLRINKLSVDTGEISIEGNIDSLRYITSSKNKLPTSAKISSPTLIMVTVLLFFFIFHFFFCITVIILNSVIIFIYFFFITLKYHFKYFSYICFFFKIISLNSKDNKIHY